MDPELVQVFCGDRHQFSEIDNLRHKARVGVPVDVRPGGKLTKKLEYGNHSSAPKRQVAVWEKAIADVASGRAIGFPKEQAGQVEGLRVSAIGVVEDWENVKII